MLIVRYDKEDFPRTLLKTILHFILMVYFMKQGEYDEETQRFYDQLALYPSLYRKT